MNEAEYNHEAAQRQAHHNYMDYLAEARTKFEDAFEALNARTFDESTFESAKIMAHKLAGNALMYGYPILGDNARNLEKFLKKHVGTDDGHGHDLFTGVGRSLFIKVISKIDAIRNQKQNSTEPSFESDTIEPDPTPDRWADPIKTEGYGIPSHKPSVLLVHSDPWLSHLMASMLGADFDVIECTHAHAAMAECVNNPPDLIIIHQTLPDMSGTDMTRFVRSVENLKLVPIVMLMVGDDPQDIVEAVEAGATDCFENAQEILPLVNHVRELIKKKQFHVLIVDDDLAVRDILRHRFETFGVRADTVEDGVKALEYLRSEQPDLIILDRMMPRLEGGAVLYQIQQEINLKSIPVMLVTAMANRDDAITWLKRGAVDYITKPFNPDEVVLRALRNLRIEDAA